MNTSSSLASSFPPPVTAQAKLADLATAWAGASRVFLRHGLDFCCKGQRSIAEACAAKGLDADALVAELQAAVTPLSDDERWDERPTAQLLTHILDQYHAAHRAELPRLLRMAQKVEAVHGDKADCPRGLAAHIEHVAQEMEQHMQKEELILFPMLLAGNFRQSGAPIAVMEEEHLEHGENLEKLRSLAHDYVPPPQACATWQALYLGLREFERDVMQHIHLENHVLFPRAARA